MSKESKIKLTYKDNKLIVKDGDSTKVFIVEDYKYGEIFRYVLKAIDQLDDEPEVHELSIVNYPDSEDQWFELEAATGSTTFSRMDIMVKEILGEETNYIWIKKAWDETADDYVLHVYLVADPFASDTDPEIISEIADTDYTILPETIGQYDESCDFEFQYNGASVTKENAYINRTK